MELYIVITYLIEPAFVANLFLNNSDLAADWNVLLSAWLWESADLDSLTEEQAVGGTTEVEHPSLLSLLDVLTLLDGDLASRDLVHTNTDESHETNGWIVGLDKDDGASSEGSQVSLTARDTVCVNLLCAWVTKTLKQRLTKVSAVLNKGLLDGAANGRVPAVVGQRGKEGLIDCAADKLRGQGVSGHHVGEGVLVAFGPEFVDELDVVLEVERLGLACVDDDAVIVWVCGFTVAILELTCEEVCIALAQRVCDGRGRPYDPKSCSRRLGGQGRT